MVVKQFRSTTWPVRVISFPGAAAGCCCACCVCCAARGSAHSAKSAVAAKICFDIVHLLFQGEAHQLPASGRTPQRCTPNCAFRNRTKLGGMNEPYRALIDAFGKGWERGDVDAICSVFTEDAVFIETPFSAPDSGMAAIREYWKDIPLY